MMRKITSILIFLLVGALFVGSVSAETHDLYEYVHTGGSGSYASGYAPSGGTIVNYDYIYFPDITDVAGLNYIAFSFSGAASALTENIGHPIEYTLNGVTKTGNLYVHYSRNLLGAVTGTRYTVIFYDWNIGTLTGAQRVHLNRSFTASYSYTTSGYDFYTGDAIARIEGFRSPIYVHSPVAYDIVVSAGSEWYNTITFADMYDGNDIGITLQREFEGTAYLSTLNVSDGASVIYSSTAAADISITYPDSVVSEVAVISKSGTTYSYPFSGSGSGSGSSTTATVTLFVKRSDTGALISNANVSIYDSVLDTYIVENSTLPGGSGSFVVNKTGDTPQDWVHYQVLAYADGFTQNVPVFFGITQDITAPVELVPVGEAPADTDNVYVQFNVRDYAANGVPSVTINLGGTAKTTNSAGYARFEVAKNITLSWTAQKTGYITSSGTVTTATISPVNVQVLLYSGVIPTYTPTPGSTSPGATPYVTPDTRTPHEKAASGLDFLLDNAENFGIMAGIILLMYMTYWMVPKKGR